MMLTAFEIPELRLVRVAGNDAMKVLNGLCTAKLVDLEAGQATEAMFTDDRGRVLAHGMFAFEPDERAFWFLGQAFDAEALVAHVDRFIFREDALPKNITSLWSGRLIDGPAECDQWRVLESVLGIDLNLACTSFIAEEQTCWFISLPITSPRARALLVPVAIENELPKLLDRLGFAPGSGAEMEDRRIGNFWPIAGRDMNERTLPQELSRDRQAISFTKGCYLGQETVARLDAMGQVQKKLCLVELSGSTNISTDCKLMRDEKEAGKLNSISPMDRDGQRKALATLRRGSTSVGCEFKIVAPDSSPIGSGIVIASGS